MMEQIVFVKFAPAFFQACPLKVEKSAHMSSPSVSHQSAFLLPQKSHTSHIHPQTFPTIFYYIYVDLATIFYYFYYFLLFLTHTYLVFSTYCYTFPNIFYFFPPSHTCSALSTFFPLSTLSTYFFALQESSNTSPRHFLHGYLDSTRGRKATPPLLQVFLWICPQNCGNCKRLIFPFKYGTLSIS